MNADTVVMIILSVVLVTMAIILILGKGDWMINTLNPARELYNFPKLRIINAAVLVIVAVMVSLMQLIGSELLFASIILGASILGFVLMETWGRR